MDTPPRAEPAANAFLFSDRPTTSTLTAVLSVAAPPTTLRSVNSRSTSKVSRHSVSMAFFRDDGMRERRERTDSKPPSCSAMHLT